jgi:hypothetical protein
MKVLRNWRMHAAKSAYTQRVGPPPTSYVTEVRETMGGRFVVDLSDRVRLALGFEPGVRIWFATRADGFAITSKPCGPRGTKRHSGRILMMHTPLRLRWLRQWNRPHQYREKLVSE